ncbi:receptor-like protein EIX2 [Dioscorea cayenensis subsp. rotundata]|uniref:Receptor-like protein EIX2 n=1 Tax=Dioscorea cayennensis subsp. rotundata TaxID=55577 RepID=A0AB40BQV6_DIOCR|nr:receptor-like protein EIX2 [Dioscorea cayenensis subsp. rotundata]
MAFLSVFVMFVTIVVSATPGYHVHGISCIENERIALLSIKEGIESNDQNWLSSWTGHDCCKWRGVSCNLERRHVIKLDLRHLYDIDDYPIPPSKLSSSLIQLHYLKHLDLSMNNFSDSPIPDFIGSLSNLQYLDLSHARFRGAVPHTLANLTSLCYLNLSSYYYEPFLQANDLHWLSRINSLQYLDLSGVDLSKVSGWLHDINMLPSLLVLQLSDTNLQGGGLHDATLSHLNFTSLRVLDLSGNGYLNITLPQWLFNLTSLVHLDLSFTGLMGSMPERVGRLRSLQYLDLKQSMIGGDIPESFGNLMFLQHLDLSYNGSGGYVFSGKLPENIGNLVHLQFLDLSNNMLVGELPESIGNLRRLQHLRLRGNRINGPLPESIGKLSSLTELDLSMNNISGTLPKSMGNLCKLENLELSSNFINGAIDDLVNGLSSCRGNKKSMRNSSVLEDTYGLFNLDLTNNRFNGTVPESIGRLAKLRMLQLQENSFVGILTENHFVNLTDLFYIDLSYNLLQLNVAEDWVPPFYITSLLMCSCRIGPKFPTWLKTQRALNLICLSEAGLSGNVPTWFWNFSLVGFMLLNISHNDLSGTIPAFPTFFLQVIDLSSNKFEGLIPELNSGSLYIIDLSDNSFSGTIPSSFASASQVEALALSHNHINGSIPLFFCGLNSLTVLDLSSNNMSGELPNCWNQLSKLAIIDLSNNSFFGSIPDAVGSLTNLQSLHLQNNSLSGNLPLSLKNASRLVALDIGENNLSGSIPAWIGENLLSLVILRLKSNMFNGIIPEQLSKLSNLQILDLSHNNLSGGIPHSFGDFKAIVTSTSNRSLLFISEYDQTRLYFNVTLLGATSPSYNYLESLVIRAKGQQREYTKVLLLVTSIDLSGNRLSGEFPNELTKLHGLRFFSLSDNLFNGKLPENIGDMNQLESLDLSINNFSGIIPQSISLLNFLGHLNLSHNKLSGKIPSGNQLQTFDASAFFWNDGLCGFPLGDCKNKTPHGSLDEGNQDGYGDWFDDLWLYIGLASGFILGFWMFILFIMINQTRRISYFRLIDKAYDWIYVKSVIYSRRLKSILTRRN